MECTWTEASGTPTIRIRLQATVTAMTGGARSEKAVPHARLVRNISRTISCGTSSNVPMLLASHTEGAHACQLKGWPTCDISLSIAACSTCESSCSFAQYVYQKVCSRRRQASRDKRSISKCADAGRNPLGS